MSRYLRAAKRVYWTLRFEILCLTCTMVGLVKARLWAPSSTKLEMGVGSSRRKPGFITSDLDFRTDFPFDLRLGLPFKAGSLEFIYAEHVLEHFNSEDLCALLLDCHRVLKPGGRLSVAVPDAAIYLQGYFEGQKFDKEKYCQYECGLSYESPIDFVNYIFYMGGHHRYMFDQAGLLAALSKAGFKNARLRQFDASLDQAGRRYESIYAEGTKAGTA
jgi:predicted SAM-dependent methyltransferase